VFYRLSGNNERLIDFPKCPHCKKGQYWREKRATVPVICFNTKSYLERHPGCLIVNGGNRGNLEHLGGVELVECIDCGYIATTELRDQILALARKYIGLRGRDVWGK